MIDVHCHYFNLQWAWTELLEAMREERIYDLARCDSRKPTTEGALLPDLGGTIEELVTTYAGLGALLTTLRATVSGNHKRLVKAAKNSQLASIPLVAPLMMDIRYALRAAPAQPELGEAPVPPSPPPPLEPQEATELAKRADDLLSAVLKNYLGKSRNLWTTLLAPLRRALVRWVLNRTTRDYLAALREDKAGQDTYELAYPSVEWSLGYKRHLAELEALQTEWPALVFPFLAIDPRRPGILNLVKGKVGVGKPFRGVKLYPPLGFLPTHPVLWEVWEYCAKEDIPVTVHTSPGVVQTPARFVEVVYKLEPAGRIVRYVMHFGKREPGFNLPAGTQESKLSASAYFANPNNWRPVLKVYNNLRLNFAHFGGNEQVRAYAREYDRKYASRHPVQSGELDDSSWTKAIHNLMKQYTSVFADVAYLPTEADAKAVASLLVQDDFVKERLMLGSDFVMVMLKLSNKGELERYFNNFASAVEKDNWDNLFEANARRFLGLG